MSSDRTIYDKEAYLVKTNESNKPLKWMLDLNAHENCEICGDKPNISVHPNRVELESELFGLDRKLSRDPKSKYQKSEIIADSLNYAPAYVCERNIQNSSFLSQDISNQYMEDLRKQSPEGFNNNTNTNKCKLTNFLDNNNIDTSNKVN
uniref:Uncharacterized protein n=1 Tax=viral metagenome TaxID=1070528 RepID=A0A6C0J7Y5_9ZZZZ